MAGGVGSVGRRVVDRLGIYIDRVPRSRVLAYVAAAACALAAAAVVVHRTPFTAADRVARLVADADTLVEKAEATAESQKARSLAAEARRKITLARAALEGGSLEEARSLALDAQGLAERVLQGVDPWEAIILDSIGDVKVQQKDRWQDARAGLKLREGDWVKTGASGSVELISSDGTRLSIGPGTLFEVHRTRSAQEPEPGSRLKVVDGTVRTQTGEQRSTVITDGGTARTDSHSESRVDVGGDRQVSLKVFGGTGSLRTTRGDRVELGRGDAVKAAADARPVERQKLPDAPGIRGPDDNAVFDAGTEPRVTLAWNAVPRIRRYLVQIASSRFFTPETLLADLKSHPRNSVSIGLAEEGSYFWRVAAVDASGAVSDWSEARRIRIAAAGSIRSAGPPTLLLAAPQVLGEHLVSVAGRTDPGASVTVNGEAATLQGDGRFQKIIAVADSSSTVVVRARNSSGGVTERKVRVAVRVF